MWSRVVAIRMRHLISINAAIDRMRNSRIMFGQLQIRALVTLLLVGMALALALGAARAVAASPLIGTPAAIHSIAASDVADLPAPYAHHLVARTSDCCASSSCGATTGAMTVAEDQAISAPHLASSIWHLAPFAVPDGLNPLADRRPPRVA